MTQQIHRARGEPEVARPAVRSVSIGPIDISASRFPSGYALPPHEHDRPIFVVFLAGAMNIQFGKHRYACMPGTVQIHPAGERHSQRFLDAGAEVVVVEPAPDWAADFRPFDRLLNNSIAHYPHAGIEAAARRIRAEFHTPDELTPVVLESLALDMLAGAARLRDALGERGRPPAWLDRTTRRLRDTFLESFNLATLARDADVHPGHLSRTFRRYHGMTLGEYIRRLRLDWAAERLRGRNDPIAVIAADAGFADQSHFTRAFKAYSGRTPGDYRARSH